MKTNLQTFTKHLAADSTVLSNTYDSLTLSLLLSDNKCTDLYKLNLFKHKGGRIKQWCPIGMVLQFSEYGHVSYYDWSSKIEPL